MTVNQCYYQNVIELNGHGDFGSLCDYKLRTLTEALEIHQRSIQKIAEAKYGIHPDYYNDVYVDLYVHDEVPLDDISSLRIYAVVEEKQLDNIHPVRPDDWENDE